MNPHTIRLRKSPIKQTNTILSHGPRHEIHDCLMTHRLQGIQLFLQYGIIISVTVVRHQAYRLLQSSKVYRQQFHRFIVKFTLIFKYIIRKTCK